MGSRRRWLLRSAGAAAAATLAGMVGAAVAQGLSDRTIVLAVPFTPGTGPDTLARILGEELRQTWNQPVIVENKAGGQR